MNTKGDVLLNSDEIELLKSKIIETAQQKIATPLKLNSHVANYAALSEHISKQTGIAISKRLLLDFFYATKNTNSKTFRTNNINTLYRYVFGMDRDAYLAATSLNAGPVKMLYYSGILPDTINQNDYDKLQLITSDSLVETFNKVVTDSELAVSLLINEHILLYATDFLLELFGKNSILNMMLEKGYYIDLIIDEALNNAGDTCIFHQKGRELLKEKFAALQKSISPDDSDEKTMACKEDDFTLLLRAISEIKNQHWFEQKRDDDTGNKMDSVGIFLPILQSIYKIPPEELWNLILDKIKRKEKAFNYFCVIGYTDYFDPDKKYEMLRYFSLFNNANNTIHKVVRIFTVPARRIKNKGWKVALEGKSKELLMQFLYLNSIYGESILMMYDIDKIKYPQNVLVHQDYVLRLPTEIIPRYSDDFLTNFLTKKMNRVIVKERLTILLKDETSESELYFAFPKDINNVNRMLRFTSDYPNQISRIFDDFANRFDYFSDHENEMQCLLIKRDDLTKPDSPIINTLDLNDYSKLNLNFLTKEIDALKRDVAMTTL